MPDGVAVGAGKGFAVGVSVGAVVGAAVGRDDGAREYDGDGVGSMVAAVKPVAVTLPKLVVPAFAAISVSRVPSLTAPTMA